MLEISIVTGFLGAGKTTLINALLREGLFPAGTLLVENEFGEIGIDGRLLEEGYPVLELSSGCICCGIGADFVERVCALVYKYQPQALIIEPSGCADLEPFLKNCRQVCDKTGGVLRRVITVVNAEALLAQLELGGPFFRDQLAKASFLALSCMEAVDDQEGQQVLEALGRLNDHAPVCVLPMDGRELMRLSEGCVHQGKPREGARDLLLRRMDGGMESLSLRPQKLTYGAAEAFLEAVARGDYGRVLRVKGLAALEGRGTCALEYIPGKAPSILPRENDSPSGLVVIGRNLQREKLSSAFR